MFAGNGKMLRVVLCVSESKCEHLQKFPNCFLFDDTSQVRAADGCGVLDSTKGKMLVLGSQQCVLGRHLTVKHGYNLGF